MEKILASLILLLTVACVQKSEIAAPVVESEPLPPVGSNITNQSRDALRPIPKPAPPSQLQTTRIVTLPAGQKPDLTVTRTLPPKINGVPQTTYTKILIVDDADMLKSEGKIVKTEDLTVTKAEVVRDKEQSTIGALTDGLANDTEFIRGRVAKFLFPEFDVPEPEPPKGKKQAQVFCYGSLSDSTCYSKPIPGQEFRRVGSF